MRSPILFFALSGTILCSANLPVFAEDNPDQAAARAALLEKMQALDAMPASTPIVNLPSDNPAQAAARSALTERLTGAAEPTPTVTSSPAPAAPASPTTPPLVTAPATVTAAPPAAVQPGSINGVSLPISADQQTRLQALDAKYRANEISPLDYFTQREAILKGQ